LLKEYEYINNHRYKKDKLISRYKNRRKTTPGEVLAKRKKINKTVIPGKQQ
jgi:hypothetical protein